MAVRDERADAARRERDPTRFSSSFTSRGTPMITVSL